MKRSLILFTGAAILALAFWLFVPTVDILPASDGQQVALDSQLQIHPSPLSRITKIAVYADDRLLTMEYNLETNDLQRPLDLKPGQTIRVETKLTSPLGVTREFVTSFNTVAPVRINAMTVDGAAYAADQPIPPQANMVFAFSKPIDQASVTLDGSEAIELQIDPDDPTRATLPPTVSLKQGATHLFRIMATAVDSALLEPKEIRASVVKPLSFYGKVDDAGGAVTIELDANAPFAIPGAVRAALQTTLPDATVTVEKQKIIISCPSLDRDADYNITINNAEGADGSFLEAPLSLTVGFKSNPSVTSGSTEGQYRGYVYTASGASVGAASGSGGSPADSGPPPGWPSCCPWPPR